MTGEYLGHAVHALIVLAGMVGVVAVLWPARPGQQQLTSAQELRVAVLRERVAAGGLVTTEPIPELVAVEPLRPSRLSQPAGTMPLLVAAVASAAAAGVHAAVTPGHVGEGLAVGLFFLLTAAAQSAWACALLLRPERPLLGAGILLNAGIVLVWMVSRTTGIPFVADGRAEAVGVLDVAATGWELVLIVCCASLLGRAGIPRPLLAWHCWPYAARCWAAVSVGLLGALTFLDLHT